MPTNRNVRLRIMRVVEYLFVCSLRVPSVALSVGLAKIEDGEGKGALLILELHIAMGHGMSIRTPSNVFERVILGPGQVLCCAAKSRSYYINCMGADAETTINVR